MLFTFNLRVQYMFTLGVHMYRYMSVCCFKLNTSLCYVFIDPDAVDESQLQCSFQNDRPAELTFIISPTPDKNWDKYSVECCNGRTIELDYSGS